MKRKNTTTTRGFRRGDSVRRLTVQGILLVEKTKRKRDEGPWSEEHPGIQLREQRVGWIAWWMRKGYKGLKFRMEEARKGFWFWRGENENDKNRGRDEKTKFHFYDGEGFVGKWVGERDSDLDGDGKCFWVWVYPLGFLMNEWSSFL